MVQDFRLTLDPGPITGNPGNVPGSVDNKWRIRPSPAPIHLYQVIDTPSTRTSRISVPVQRDPPKRLQRESQSQIRSLDHTTLAVQLDPVIQFLQCFSQSADTVYQPVLHRIGTNYIGPDVPGQFTGSEHQFPELLFGDLGWRKPTGSPDPAFFSMYFKGLWNPYHHPSRRTGWTVTSLFPL